MPFSFEGKVLERFTVLLIRPRGEVRGFIPLQKSTGDVLDALFQAAMTPFQIELCCILALIPARLQKNHQEHFIPFQDLIHRSSTMA